MQLHGFLSDKKKEKQNKRKSDTWMDWYLRARSCQFFIQKFHVYYITLTLHNPINLLNVGGTFLSEKNIQNPQSHESSIDNDVFLNELKTSDLITKIEPAVQAEVFLYMYQFNSLLKLYCFLPWLNCTFS